MTSPSVLLTDLYQLRMLQGYFRAGMMATAVFEFFVRRLPEHRGFLIAAGLEQVLDYLGSFAITERECDWLAARGDFDPEFVGWLGGLRFTGDVHGMPEGAVFFPNEPILRVTAPLPEAQLVESRLINILHFQTLVASKAARMVLAAPGKQLVDFGLRRAHGAEAGLLAARAAYLAGFAGSATLEAERLFGVPAFGTMAHSYVQAHDDERDAFLDFARACPHNVVLLIDTYDTEAAAEKVVTMAPRLQREGIAIGAVRLDSGDLAAHARNVRRILDRGGCGAIKIFASGNIDEYALADMVGAGAPIDGFGVGTKLTTSADAPYLDCAYKLQEYAGLARRKRSVGKATWPGRKQVHRRYADDDTMTGDIITLEGQAEDGIPLIRCVMRNGERIESTTLAQARRHTARQIAALPAALRTVHEKRDYPVKIAEPLQELAAEVDRRTGGDEPLHGGE